MAMMAQIPGYANDIFISYAHDDNQAFGIARAGWTFRAITRQLASKAPGNGQPQDLARHQRMREYLFDDAIRTPLKPQPFSSP
jgi:hypothetical protein